MARLEDRGRHVDEADARRGAARLAEGQVHEPAQDDAAASDADLLAHAAAAATTARDRGQPLRRAPPRGARDLRARAGRGRRRRARRAPRRGRRRGPTPRSATPRRRTGPRMSTPATWSRTSWATSAPRSIAVGPRRAGAPVTSRVERRTAPASGTPSSSKTPSSSHARRPPARPRSTTGRRAAVPRSAPRRSSLAVREEGITGGVLPTSCDTPSTRRAGLAGRRRPARRPAVGSGGARLGLRGRLHDLRRGLRRALRGHRHLGRAPGSRGAGGSGASASDD